MPNWCFTEYRAVGDKEDILNLYKLMSGLQNRKESLVGNDFGKTWMGNLVTALGYDWQEVRCRGSWSELQIMPDDTLYFQVESAWSELYEVRSIIEERFPSIKLYYISEEPGMQIYETNDADGWFWPPRYCFETEDELFEFETPEEAIAKMESVIGRKLNEGEDPEEALYEWAEDRGEYASLYHYEIVSD